MATATRISHQLGTKMRLKKKKNIRKKNIQKIKNIKTVRIDFFH